MKLSTKNHTTISDESFKEELKKSKNSKVEKGFKSTRIKKKKYIELLTKVLSYFSLNFLNESKLNQFNDFRHKSWA